MAFGEQRAELGRAAQASEPGPVDLQFTFLEARVGDAVLARGGEEAPQVFGQQIVYARGAMVETYESLRDGVEQSFVLNERPAVAGDLVVRGRITCELQAVTGDDGTHSWLRPGVGGVHIGAVTGFDAAGRRVAIENELGAEAVMLRLSGSQS